MPRPCAHVREDSNSLGEFEGFDVVEPPRLEVCVSQSSEPPVARGEPVLLFKEPERDDGGRERVGDGRVTPIEDERHVAIDEDVAKMQVVVLDARRNVGSGELRAKHNESGQKGT